jgi:hypothetical protein
VEHDRALEDHPVAAGRPEADAEDYAELVATADRSAQ